MSLTVVLIMEVLDFEAEVVTINLAAIAGADKPPEVDNSGHLIPVFSGVFSESVVRDSLTRVLYPVLAKAMNLTSAASSEWIEVSVNNGID